MLKRIISLTRETFLLNLKKANFPFRGNISKLHWKIKNFVVRLVNLIQFSKLIDDNINRLKEIYKDKYCINHRNYWIIAETIKRWFSDQMRDLIHSSMRDVSQDVNLRERRGKPLYYLGFRLSIDLNLIILTVQLTTWISTPYVMQVKTSSQGRTRGQ